MLGFPAVTLRDRNERPEALDAGGIACSGVEPEAVREAVAVVLDAFDHDGPPAVPAEYRVPDVSRRVIGFIRSTLHDHDLSASEITRNNRPPHPLVISTTA